MITQKRHQWRAFAGGETSPEMYGRVDIARHSISLKRCYNTMVTPQGALENRAGSKYITSTKDNGPAWLSTFVRPDGQGFLLEFGDTYARIHGAGNTIGVAGSPTTVTAVTISAPDAAVFTAASHGLTPGDEIVLQGFALTNPDEAGTHTLLGFMNRVYYTATTPTANTFTISPRWPLEGGYEGESWSEFADAPYDGLVDGGVVAAAGDITLTELAVPYSQSHVRFASFGQYADDFVVAHKLYEPARIVRAGDNDWSYTALTFNVTLAAPGSIAATAEGTPGPTPITYSYTVTTTDEFDRESLAGTPDTAANQLRTVGNQNIVSWSSVTDAEVYTVYKGIGGGAHGLIGTAEGSSTSFADDHISPDYTSRPPEELTAFDSAGNYPGTIGFIEQRAVYAGTVDEPQTFWVSGIGNFDYFLASFPPLDDQAFTYKLSSGRSAPIVHVVALRDLLFFTRSAVFWVYTTDGAPFAPTTVSSVPVVAEGAHEIAKPQEAGANVLFPTGRGKHLYELKFADGNGYSAEDLSVVAAHLIDNYNWVQTAYRRAPYPVWFGLRDDGKIVALTYMPEQQVAAWHWHELPGAHIESIAVVPEGSNDNLYVIARRTIGEATVRYIERIEPRNFGASQTEAYFVDAGVTQRLPFATDTVTGLDHLEGEEVYALADGQVLGPYTVASGSVTLDTEAEVAHVGLAYTSVLHMLPLAYPDAQGYGVGIVKNVSQVSMRVKQTYGVEAGTDADYLRPVATDPDDELGETPDLKDGVYSITVDPSWDIDTVVVVQQSLPLPFTITSMALDYVDGD